MLDGRCYCRKSHLIYVMFKAACDVEALAFCIAIIPMVFVCFAIWLNVVAYPLGAILFYCVFVPLAGGSAVVDYVRKQRNL